MLYLNEAPEIQPLVRALSKVLAEPLEDPISREWVAVPTLGMQRWTKLELARTLGSSSAREDGISANIDFNFPGKLRQLIIDVAHSELAGSEPDPWHIDQLVWTVLEVLDDSERDLQSQIMPELPVGASPYGRARRIADLFDRYALHRPELIKRWISGKSVDAIDNALAKELAWQPELWRRVRERIGEESPPERFGMLLDRVREGEFTLDLPPRLSIFGITALPGGSGFLDLIEALASTRDVHCFFLEPSPIAARRIEESLRGTRGNSSLLRSHDHSQDILHHPLLTSWGSPFRERAALLAVARPQRESLTIRHLGERPSGARSQEPITLLARIQDDLRTDRAPDGTFELKPDDGSIEIHACYGPARQVEVLRDAILHLLQDDPDLEEEEIVVLCPAISDYAPYIEAGFGLPQSAPRVSDGETFETPANPGSTFTYHMSDRSLRSPNPLLEAFDAFLELVGGRCSASEVLEFIALDPVRRRFAFDDDALAKINQWARIANVRWGLSADHRFAMGFPERYELNTWRAAVESLLIGVTTHDLEYGLAEGDIAPIGIEGEDIEIVGRFSELLDRLDGAAQHFKQTRPPRQWCEVLAGASDDFFDVDPAQSWQSDGLRRLLARISESAIHNGRESAVGISLADMRRVLTEGLRGAPGRSEFFRGGVTVTSLTPLRWVPFKVVCLLGLDDAPAGDVETNGDDVMALAPQLGDPDPRSEARQSILEAMLAAQEKLIVTFTAFDPRTNLPASRSVEFLELEDTVIQTLTPTSQLLYRQKREIVHPRQSYDDRNFEAGRLGHDGPWSFNAAALAGARARRNQDLGPRPLLMDPIQISGEEGIFSIEDLREFLRHPVRCFLKKSLQIYRPFDQNETSDELPIALEPTERSDIGRRLLATRLSLSGDEVWKDLREAWWMREQARGALPVGHLAHAVREEIEGEVSVLINTLSDFGIDPSISNEAPEMLSIVLEQDGPPVKRVTGSLTVGEHESADGLSWRGTWDVKFSRLRSVDELSAWLDLLVLTLHAPDTYWTSVSLRRPVSGKDSVGVVNLALAGKSKEARIESACRGLSTVLRLAELGRNEPLPLFASLSKALHYETPEESDWASGRKNVFSDGTDRDNVLAFGNIKLRELLQIPARVADPGEGPSRAARLAHYLWGTFEATSIEGVNPIPESNLAKSVVGSD